MNLPQPVDQFVVRYRWTRALAIVMAVAFVLALLAEIVIPGGPVRTAFVRPSLQSVSGALAYAGAAGCFVWGAFLSSVKVRVNGSSLEIIRGWGLQRRRYSMQQIVRHWMDREPALRLEFADGFRLKLPQLDAVEFRRLLAVLQRAQ